MNRKQRRAQAKVASSSPNLQSVFEAALRHHQAGQLAQAEQLYRLVLAGDAHHADSLHLLGVIAHQVGLNDVAVELIGKAIDVNGSSAAYYSNLGIALKELGRLDDAVEAHDTAIRIKPDFADAHYNLGIALKELGRLDDAVEAYDTAIRIKPDFAEAHYNRGNALKDLGRLDDAVEAYDTAIRVKPDFAEAHSNRGNALEYLGRLDDAVEAFETAIMIKPDFAEAHSNRGNAMKGLGRIDDAVEAYDTAIRVEPDFAEAHYNLGIALEELGRIVPAAESFTRAQICDPTVIRHSYSASLLCPIIPSSIQDIANWRERYQTGIADLCSLASGPEDPVSLGSPSFYLSYHGINNRPMMEALCRLFRAKVPSLTFTSPHTEGWTAARGRRIRVGLLSEYLFFHTIGKLYQGLVHQLDRNRFEVVLIHSHKAKRDAFSAVLDARADRAVVLPKGLVKQQEAVADERIDVLLYPDIGMSPDTYFLAFSRLAPVQMTSWGHPDTSGLDTIDYFISSMSIEPPAADQFYAERLVRLSRLPCFYEPMTGAISSLSRSEFGLPESGTLYGCPQSLFKFHPDFDAVLAAIAAGDPEGHIVLLSGKYDTWTDLLRQRWRNSHPLLIDRVVFLPRQTHDRFMALMKHFDVLLDPIHFGSGNTLYEAMVFGTPIVTWPGKFMRGRIVSGAYQQMGLADAPIAERLEDYAPLALALGRGSERQQALRVRTAAAAEHLFADHQAVREFETFLIAAVEAAASGQRLPIGWKPGLTEGRI